MPGPSETGGQDGLSRLRGATGQELRERRQALGLDLGQISEVLCIRREYLEALENGDYGALPGHTYAVGFVRTYAKHLGLDGDATARQFKLEAAGERPAARLDFPEPLSESRIPTGAIVLVTVLLAAAIYGLWYYLNARNLDFSDVVPEVPSHFAADPDAPLPPAGGDQSAGLAAEARGGGNPATNVPPPPETGTGPMASARAGVGETVPGTPPPAPVEDGLPVPSADAAPSDSPPAMEPAAAPGPESATLQGQEPLPGPAAEPPPAPSPLRQTADEPAETPLPAEPEAGTRVASVASGRPTAVPPEPPPRTSQIEIRAVADSWVQVRDREGSLLMGRILSEGSSYVVPPEEGLTLVTGNAGGLEILVDGAVVPPLGPVGAVRRDVALDPERLKSGTAVER